MMGMRMPETCWAVFKRQVINFRSCCIWLVNSIESMMMHGLAKPKFEKKIFCYSSFFHLLQACQEKMRTACAARSFSLLPSCISILLKFLFSFLLLLLLLHVTPKKPWKIKQKYIRSLLFPILKNLRMKNDDGMGCTSWKKLLILF